MTFCEGFWGIASFLSTCKVHTACYDWKSRNLASSLSYFSRSFLEFPSFVKGNFDHHVFLISLKFNSSLKTLHYRCHHSKLFNSFNFEIQIFHINLDDKKKLFSKFFFNELHLSVKHFFHYPIIVDWKIQFKSIAERDGSGQWKYYKRETRENWLSNGKTISRRKRSFLVVERCSG